MAQRGFILIGSSAFEGQRGSSHAQLLDHAKQIGADVVLTNTAYKGSEQSATPILVYNPGTTSTTVASGKVDGNAYSSRGGATYVAATFSETETTTTQGTYSVETIPTTIHKYSWQAQFWRKAFPPVLGIRAVSLPDELRQRLHRNTGVLVETVTDDTPAFYANIVPGDILIAVGSDSNLSANTYRNVLEKYADQTTVIKLLRSGREIELTIKLNPREGNARAFATIDDSK